jgi:hypothetical protein
VLTAYYCNTVLSCAACMQVGRGIDSGAYAHEHFKRDDPDDIRVCIYIHCNNLNYHYLQLYNTLFSQLTIVLRVRHS